MADIIFIIGVFAYLMTCTICDYLEEKNKNKGAGISDKSNR